MIPTSEALAEKLWEALQSFDGFKAEWIKIVAPILDSVIKEGIEQSLLDKEPQFEIMTKLVRNQAVEECALIVDPIDWREGFYETPRGIGDKIRRLKI